MHLKVVLGPSVKTSPLQGCGFHCILSQGLSLHRNSIVLLCKDLPLITVFSDFMYSSGLGCSVSSFALGSKNSCVLWPGQFVVSIRAEQTFAFFLSVSQLHQPSSVHLPLHLPTLCWEGVNSKSNECPFCFFRSRKLMPWCSRPPAHPDRENLGDCCGLQWGTGRTDSMTNSWNTSLFFRALLVLSHTIGKTHGL